jgi:hypothetical protein
MPRIFACFLVQVFALFWSVSISQTIQLGSGTGEQWEYSSGPVNIYYRRTVCQFVYTAAELSAEGASSISPITELGFYIGQAPIYSIPNYTIKIKHTTATDVSAALGTTGWTTVKNGFTYTPVAGDWDMITLDDQTFVWDGTSSIGVEICWNQVVPNWNASGKVRIYSTTNGYRYRWTDAAGSSCGAVPTATSLNKPQVRIVFVPGTTTTWTGAISTDWFDQNNWTAGIPTQIMNAVIPFGPMNQPSITGSSATANSLTVDANASLMMPSGDTLNIYGDWTMNGTFTGARSTVIFRGVGMAMNLMQGASNQQLNNLEIRSDAGLVLVSGTYEIQGSLRLKGGVFVPNNRATLVSNVMGTGRMTGVRNLCKYQLVMTDSYGDGWDGGSVTVRIDGEVYGVFNAEGTGTTVIVNIPSGSDYELTYTSGLFENENSYVFNDPSGTPEYTSGTPPPTGAVHSGTSSCTFINPFLGQISIQRYLSLGNIGWREMSTGVQNRTLQDWQNDGITMSGFTGSDYPGFGWASVLTYNENNANGDKNNGWVAATNISDTIDFNTGHRVYIGSGTRTTEIMGVPVVGTQTISLDYQDDAGAIDQEGWNLIGNPYVCSIDWDSISILNKVAVDDAIWIWNATAGNYGVYVGGTGGFGTNDVRADIASSQSFWVHANDLNPKLVISEDDKSEQDPRFVKSITDQAQLKLKLESDVNPYYDETILAWRDDATNQLDEKDGGKLFSPVTDAPSISFKHDSALLSVNSLNTNTPYTSIPVQALAGQTGNHRIIASNLHTLHDVPCVILEDLVLDSLVDLHQDTTYEFFQSMLYTGERFVLHVGQWYNGDVWGRCWYLPNQDHQDELTVDVENIEVKGVKLYPNPVDEVLFVELPEEMPLKSGRIEVLSITGSVLISGPLKRSSQLNVGALASGMYILRVVGKDNDTLLNTFVKQ